MHQLRVFSVANMSLITLFIKNKIPTKKSDFKVICFCGIYLLYLSVLFVYNLVLSRAWLYTETSKTIQNHQVANMILPVSKYKWAMTCDFQQCGILTSVNLDKPVQLPFKLKNSKSCSVSGVTLVKYSSG